MARREAPYLPSKHINMSAAIDEDTYNTDDKSEANDRK